MSEENPFSFSNFAPTAEPEPEDLPFKLDTEPKKKKKKKKSAEVSIPTMVVNEAPVGSKVKKDQKEDNPFAFTAFVQQASQPKAQPASQPTAQPSNLPPPSSTAAAPPPPLPSEKRHKRNSSLPPLPSQDVSQDVSDASSASSMSDSDSDILDSDDDDSGKPPTPAKSKTEVKKLSNSDSSGGGGSIMARLKRRMVLLNQQLDAAKSELEMTKEQNELDTYELREENKKLKKQLKSSTSKLQKAEKIASDSAAQLARRKDSERREAEVLEDFTARIQQNLESSNARAAAAEAQVASLTAELNHVKSHNLSGGALGQVRAAKSHLDALSKDSEENLRKLCEGVKTFQLVSQLLDSLGKIEE